MADRAKVIIPEKYQGKELYSFSRLETFKHCPHEFYLTYIKKMPRLQNCYGDIGGVVHDITDALQRKEITNDEAINQFNQNILRIELLGRAFPSEKVRKNFIECITHFLKNYKPIEAEKFEIEKELLTVIGKTKTLILGYLDIIYYFHDDIVEIYDYKTSTMFSAKEIPIKARQLVLYAYALGKEYGIKVTKIKFNMLKYATVTWKGATKMRSATYARNEIIIKLKNELKKDFGKLGKSDMEIAFILAEAQNKNEIPKEFADKYKIEDCYLEVPFSESTISELENYVDGLVSDINTRDKENEDEWESCDIEKNSFYCGVLCSQKKNCSYFKNYCESNNLSSNKNENNVLNNLFKTNL